MARKFIEFLEAASLIILTAVMVIGVYKYVDSKEEPKEEDPIVDVEPGGDETPDIEEPQIKEYYLTFENSPIDRAKIDYVDGMTWGDLCSLDYDDEFVNTSCISYKLYDIQYDIYLNDILVKFDDVIDLSKVYTLKIPTPKCYLIGGSLYNLSHVITLYFESGMTWAEWCESEYNKIDLYNDGEHIYLASGEVAIFNDSLLVGSNDLIVKGCEYDLMNVN